MSEPQDRDLLPAPLTIPVDLRAGIRRLGAAQLEVTNAGLRFHARWKSVFPPDGVLETPWAQVRGLKDQLLAAQRFSANLLGEQTLTVLVKRAPPEAVNALAHVFGQLPPAATALRCPACSGPVANNACQACGKSYSEAHRTKGLFALLLGGFLLLIGAILTMESANPRSGTVVVFWGLMLVGLYYFVIGLIRVLTGRPAS